MIFISDINSNTVIEINPNNFQVIAKHNNNIVETPRFSSGLILLEDNISEVNQDLLTNKLRKMDNLLKFSSPLYLFVKNDAGYNKNNIKELLTGTKILKGELSFLPKLTKELSVFETRKFKKTKRVEINLLSLDKQDKYKYPWAHQMFEKLVDFYKQYGCYIVNPKESDLYTSLIHCKNARKAYEDLSEGNGIKYIANCGCIFENKLNGTRSKLYVCNHDDHSLNPEKIDWFKQMINDVCEKKTEKEMFCSSCNGNLERHGRSIKEYADKSVAIKFITYCPHCGSDNGDFKEKRRYFKQKELMKEWNSVIEERNKKD